MSNPDAAYYRTLLAGAKEKLELSLVMADPTKESITPDKAIGRLTRLEAMQAQSMNAATRARQQKRLRQIERAMDALEEGTYGICVQCGNKVSRGRLEIMPETRLCVACARNR